MSKKRGKSPAQPAAGNSKWDVAIATAPFVDETWSASIGYVVAHKYEDYELINVLGDSVNGGSRRKFTFISKDELYKLVHELGNPKVKKAKETPTNFEVCEAVKPFLDSGEPVPLPLIAKLIKFRMLTAKTEDLKKIDADKKGKSDVAAKGKKGGKDAPKERGKSAGKKGGAAGKKSPEPPSVKGDTKLRKRGEEDPDAKFIDDEPDDGSSRYFVVTGFNHPQLLPFLAEIGVAPDCVVKFSQQNYERYTKPAEDNSVMDAVPPPPPDEKMMAQEEERRIAIEGERKSLEHFWRDVTMILRGNVRLKDVAMLEYEVKNLLMPEDLGDPEQKLQLGTALFEDVSCLLYDLLDLRRQWRTYLTNLHLTRVPLATPGAGEHGGPVSPRSVAPGAPSEAALSTGGGVTAREEGESVSGGEGAAGPLSLTTEVDMRYYQELLDAWPMETVSVELMVHCMVEQVEATEQNKPTPSEIPEPKRDDNVDHKLASHFASLALKLSLSDDEIAILQEAFPSKSSNLATSGSNVGPELVNPSDSIAHRSAHLDPDAPTLSVLQSPKEIEMAMLGLSRPFSDLVKLPRPAPQLARHRAARLQELIHFCLGNGFTQEDIDRAFKQFVLESLDLTSTDLNGIIVRSRMEGYPVNEIPWDDPYPAFKGLRDLWTAEDRQWNQPEKEGEGHSEQMMDPVTERSQLPEDHSSNEGSRPTTPNTSAGGILKRSRTPSPAPRQRSSVHFDNSAFLNVRRDSPPDIAEPQPDNDEVMMALEAAQKRWLEEWCFAEHLEPHLLVQVLRSAIHELPFLDTYYHRRDHSLFVVLHNPHHSEVLSNHSQWQHWLHADLGFRNYLEHVAEAIGDWTREQEAIYEASVLQKEVDASVLDDEEASRKAAADSAAGSGKKGAAAKKGAKKSPASSRPASAERSEVEDIRIRSGSLKALKMEMDRIQREKEEEERKKNEKRTKSPGGKKADKEKPAASPEKGGKTSRSSAKSKKAGSRSSSVEPPPPQQLETVPEGKEEYWPFRGYDLANNIVNVCGDVTHMFPVDGGTIRTERVDFVQGSTTVRTSVLKDGHVFCVHITDPVHEVVGMNHVIAQKEAELTAAREAAGENDVIPEPEPLPTSFFGSFTGLFNDGLSVSLSSYGASGEPSGLSRPEPEAYVLPSTAQMGSEDPGLGSAKGKTSHRGSVKAPSRSGSVVGDELMEGTAGESGSLGPKEDTKMEKVVFQGLNLTTPDGQRISVGLEGEAISTDDRRLLVKLSYPMKTGPSHVKGKQTPFSEHHRFVTIDGVVIKVLQNGTTVMLYPDGSVAESKPMQARTVSSAAIKNLEKKEEDKTKKSAGARGSKAGGRSLEDATSTAADIEIPVYEAPPPPVAWSVTLPEGQRYTSQPQGLEVIDEMGEDTTTELQLPGDDPQVSMSTPRVTPHDPLPMTVASDPSSGQVLYTRADKVLMVHWSEAEVSITEHADSTRITLFTHYQEIMEEMDAETGEEGSRRMETHRYVRVECPGYATLLINQTTGEVETKLGATLITSNPLGHHMIEHTSGGQLGIQPDGTVLYTGRLPRETAYLQPDGVPTYVLRHNAKIICEVVDMEGNSFTVDPSGNCHVMLSGQGSSEEEHSVHRSDSAGGRSAHSSIAGGMVHYGEHAPRFFIVHADGSGTQLLRYRDVAEYLAEAEGDPAAAVIKEEIQDCPQITGITVLRPPQPSHADRFSVPYVQGSILPAGLCSRDLQTLPDREEKKPGPKLGSNAGKGLSIGEQEALRNRMRDQQKVGSGPIKPSNLKALEFRQLVQYRPITDQDRKELKSRLKEYAEYVQARLENTKAVEVRDPRQEEERFLAAQILAQSSAVRAQFQSTKPVQDMYTTAAAQECLPPVPPTPQPKRTEADWDRDRREVEAEKINKAALRNKDIPNYFRSEFGKDFLLTQASDIHHLAKKLDVFPPSNPESRVASRAKADTDKEGKSGFDTPPEDTTVSAQDSRVSGGRPRLPTYKIAQGYSSLSLKENKSNKFPYYDPTISPEAYKTMPTAPSQSLLYTVTGDMRSRAVPLPAYLKATRPHREPNSRQARIEDPVRRRILTVGLVGGAAQGQLAMRRSRGIDLLPGQVEFGLLREGFTYRRRLILRNTGIEVARYKVKHPPPSSGIRLFFRPGPIAAGLSTEIDIEVYAIAVGVEGGSGVGCISHNLSITTETDHLVVNIRGRVMTAEDYDQQPDLSLTPGVELITKGPPPRDGIVRPRKDTCEVKN